MAVPLRVSGMEFIQETGRYNDIFHLTNSDTMSTYVFNKFIQNIWTQWNGFPYSFPGFTFGMIFPFDQVFVFFVLHFMFNDGLYLLAFKWYLSPIRGKEKNIQITSIVFCLAISISWTKRVTSSGQNCLARNSVSQVSPFEWSFHLIRYLICWDLFLLWETMASTWMAKTFQNNRSTWNKKSKIKPQKLSLPLQLALHCIDAEYPDKLL